MPAATQEDADAHATEPGKTAGSAAAFAGSGASAAVHDVPDPVTSSPCPLPEESV